MTESRDDSGLAAIDEILQVMFWLEGEGLAEAVEPRDLVRFVGLEEPELARLLERLATQGLLSRVSISGVERYVFTTVGREEAARRFADEFADMTKPGHGECGDADCECHRTGSAEDCRHRAADVE